MPYTVPPPTDMLELAEWRKQRAAAGKPLHLTHREVAENAAEEQLEKDFRLEREIQNDCIRLYRAHGCSVYITSVKMKVSKKAKVTPGVSDLIVFHTRARSMFFHECKNASGRLEPSQTNFQSDALAVGVPYIVGGIDAARNHLRRIGVLNED